MKRANSLYLGLCFVLGLSPIAQSNTTDPAEQLESLAGLAGGEYGRVFDGGARPPASLNTASPNATTADRQNLKQAMLENLDFIKTMISVQYAPAEWKEQQFGWNLDAETQKAKDEVMKGELTLRDYHKIVRRLLTSTRDYHVSVQFAQTESAALPFSVMGVNGRYFITKINRNKLPESSFPFKVGDELLAFDGKPVGPLIQEIKQQLGESSPLTDNAIAALYVTSRRASKPMDVPQGPVILTIKPAGSQTTTHQLIWDYTPEAIQFKSKSYRQALALPIPLPWLADASWAGADELQAAGGSPSDIGSRNSFVPYLGPVVWESDEDNPFHAYIYRSQENGKLIGCVRIPSYTPEDADKAIAAFAKIITRFNTATDGMVIDQVNNPGGSVFYLYALVSMLSNQAMSTPRHQIALTQKDLLSAADFLKNESYVKSDADAKKYMGDTLGGYPVSYEVFRHMAEFSRFILNQWNSGKTLTDQTHIHGVDYINPSTTVKYAKPIMVLVNELDFSGGDFFPAILQDNKRAVIFGARTSGAGGYVRTISYPNQLGISHFTLTGSIAHRIDGNPIENLGVTPDIKYAPDAADFQNGFKNYAKAVNDAMSGLLK